MKAKKKAATAAQSINIDIVSPPTPEQREIIAKILANIPAIPLGQLDSPHTTMTPDQIRAHSAEMLHVLAVRAGEVLDAWRAQVRTIAEYAISDYAPDMSFENVYLMAIQYQDDPYVLDGAVRDLADSIGVFGFELTYWSEVPHLLAYIDDEHQTQANALLAQIWEERLTWTVPDWWGEPQKVHPTIPTRHLPSLRDISDPNPYIFQASPFTDAFRIKQWSRDKANGHVVGAVGNASVDIRAGEKLGPEEMDILVMSCAILARCNEWRKTKKDTINRLAEISIKDYMEYRGVTEYKHASKQLQTAAENLAGTAFDVSQHPFTYHIGKGGNTRKRRFEYFKIWPIEKAWQENGKLYVQYTESFVFYIANSFLSRFPLREYMRLRGQNTRGDDKASRNPNAAGLLFNLWPHVFQQLKGADCLCDTLFSVPVLISYCPEIPDPDDPLLARSKKDNPKLFFVNPLCAALDACEDIFSWEWCEPGGAELDLSTIAKADAHQWRTVKNLFIKIRPYPQYSPVELPELNKDGNKIK